MELGCLQKKVCNGQTCLKSESDGEIKCVAFAGASVRRLDEWRPAFDDRETALG
jgi:hypothetical protein